jgi:hypothetical protein
MRETTVLISLTTQSGGKTAKTIRNQQKLVKPAARRLGLGSKLACQIRVKVQYAVVKRMMRTLFYTAACFVALLISLIPVPARALTLSQPEQIKRAHYLNPNTGRFWTMDTTEGENEDPLSLHKYLYTEGNPINNTDPSGNDIGDLDFSSLDSFSIGGLGVQSETMARQLGGIDVDVYIWSWRDLGFVSQRRDSVGHVMVFDDDGTQHVEVSQFPHPPGAPSRPKGRNYTFTYNDTRQAEQQRDPNKKFLVHLPYEIAFHNEVDDQQSRPWWVWWPHGPNETQCARAGYDVLKAGGLPLWGHNSGEIMPGALGLALDRFANSKNQNNTYSVERIH